MTAAATGRPTINLDESRAARIEASGEPIEVLFSGRTFTCPPTKQWPMAALDAMVAGDLSAGLRALLGGDADAFIAEATIGDVEELFRELAALSGLTLGE